MFTGIVDHCGEIESCQNLASGIEFCIKTQFTKLLAGESISVDGICLTVTVPMPYRFYCQLSPETCQVTSAKLFVPGRRVNLERSLRLGDTLGGHLVMGHVDTVAILKQKIQQGEFWSMTFGDLSSASMAYFCQKGSVAVNGVSLTINAIFTNAIEVMVIPHTLVVTNLGNLKIDDAVNIEFDTLARYAVRQLNLMTFNEIPK